MNSMFAIAVGSLFAVSQTGAAPGPEADRIDVVIVAPGAPDVEKQAEKFVGDLTLLIAREAGIDPSALGSRFFGSGAEAAGHLAAHRDSFVIASLGFFLSRGRDLNLVPLASVEMTAGPNDRYVLVVRKGRYDTLAGLKGKTLAGNTLYEDSAFLSRVVFDGTVDVSSYFILKPTPRPLSALRQLAEDKLDAVLLDRVQYESLRTLPFASRIEAVYTSPVLPALGVMMVDTPATRRIRDRFLKALIALGAGEEGKTALKSFGVKGFAPVAAESFSDVLRKYDAPSVTAGAGR